MDSRKRDWVSVAERLPADDDWPCALATIDRGDFDWVDAWIWGPIPKSVTHWMSLTILTAEPEPCEDARELARAILLKYRTMGDYDVLAASREIAAYATQVADKRAEEMRATLETLREFVAEAVEWSKAYPPDLWPEPTPGQVDTVCRSLGFSIDRIAAMVLRGYTIRWSEKARALLAAAEPKP